MTAKEIALSALFSLAIYALVRPMLDSEIAIVILNVGISISGALHAVAWLERRA